MKRAIIFLVLLYCFTRYCSEAAVSRSPPHPARQPGGCYSEQTGHMTAAQKITVPGHCKSAKCGSSGVIIYHSCGSVATNTPGCRKSSPDLSKPYPECCPRIVCD